MAQRFLICTDLDRTILPNGFQPESPQARPLLRRLAEHPSVTLVYVSGRYLGSIEAAIRDYELPLPDYAIGDVGTSIYRPAHGEWRLWEQWSQRIGADWHGRSREEIASWFEDIEQLAPQEPAKQNRFKLSYYTPADLDVDAMFAEMQTRLSARDIKCSLVWSVDETSDTGLIDLLPARATKLSAVQFLMDESGFDAKNTLFAGDSGNDLPVLVSGIPAVLVANATDEVRRATVETCAASGREQTLYLARGGFLDMNGNYAAGVLEGVAHFYPQLIPWLAEAS